MVHHSENPYETPANGASAKPSKPISLMRSMATVLGSAVLFGLGGLGIGATLGVFLPGYYRSVFSNGTDPNFDPVAVGIGLGLTQGIVLGVVIGLILVALFYWKRAKPNA